MALGDQAGLQAVQALTATFPDLLAAIGGDEDKLTAALAQIEQDAITRGLAGIREDLATFKTDIVGPLMIRLDSANATAATLVGLFQAIVDRGIMLTVPPVPPDPAK